MKVLIVCRRNAPYGEFKFEINHVFVHEQMQSLQKLGIEFDLFLISGQGKSAYIENLRLLRKQINTGDYKLIHAFYGLSGLFATLQKNVPVVTSFLGCDVNTRGGRKYSYLAHWLSAHSIFVEKNMVKKLRARRGYSIIPFGVDFENTFFPLDKKRCRQELNLGLKAKLVLFASSSKRPEKNYGLAREAVQIVGNGDIQIMQLGQNYTRAQVNKLINACDLLLMTSLREGSPQIIKEAMACAVPIVSTDVGDVKQVLQDTDGCYITSFAVEDVARNIGHALDFSQKTNGRAKIKSLGMLEIAGRILKVYESVLSRN